MIMDAIGKIPVTTKATATSNKQQTYYYWTTTSKQKKEEGRPTRTRTLNVNVCPN